MLKLQRAVLVQAPPQNLARPSRPMRRCWCVAMQIAGVRRSGRDVGCDVPRSAARDPAGSLDGAEAAQLCRPQSRLRLPSRRATARCACACARPSSRRSRSARCAITSLDRPSPSASWCRGSRATGRHELFGVAAGCHAALLASRAHHRQRSCAGDFMQPAPRNIDGIADHQSAARRCSSSGSSRAGRSSRERLSA